MRAIHSHRLQATFKWHFMAILLVNPEDPIKSVPRTKMGATTQEPTVRLPQAIKLVFLVAL